MRLQADASRILAVATGSVSQLGLSAGAALVTTVLLPVADRGRYVLVVTILGVTAPLVGLGSNVGLRRLHPSAHEPHALERAYVRLSAGGALAHGLIGPVSVWAVNAGHSSFSAGELLAIGGLGVAQAMSWQLVELWYARLEFRTGAVYATLNAGCALLAAGCAFLSPSFVDVVACQALSALVLQAAQIRHVRANHLQEADASSMRTLATAMVRVGAPSLVMTAGMSLTFRLDRVILAALSGPQAVAIYALSGSFSELPRFIPAAFGQIANGQAARQKARLGLRSYLVPATALTSIAILAAGGAGYGFMSHINPTYRESVQPMVILLFAEFALIPYSIVIRMILGSGRINLSAGVGLVAIAASAVAYWVAVRLFSIEGAAWASLVVYGSVSAVCLVIHRKEP